MDQMNIAAWAGRTKTESGSISELQAQQIHATIGEGSAPRDGDTLPPLWHWCAFPPLSAMQDLGRDGHPGVSDFLPPVRLERRMWAGGSLRFHAPLRVGDPLERTSRVRSVEKKASASGPMVFVTVDHAIYGPRGLAVEERQDIVYLPMPERFVPPKKRAQTGDAQGSVDASEALLFRYSAVTFNAHRIHYDRDYAMNVEKYPGLVVHGPLQASLLMRTAINLRGRSPSLFDFRGVHPLFAGTPVDLTTQAEDAAILHLWTGQDGHQGMQASAIWEETQ